MLPIPKDLISQFNSLLYQKAIPEEDHPHYRKWLRYYLDFCKKYGFRQSETKSMTPFINKLKEKNQSDKQQKQAVDAISIYYGQSLAKNGKVTAFKPKYDEISSKKGVLKSTGASWVTEYDNLHSEIKLRHYAKSTLRTYTTWVSQFQGFTKSKSPKLLGTQDVKDFLSHLAVKKKVAASTQNQAFNALLFFYRMC